MSETLKIPDKKVDSLGSFEEWSLFVRYPVKTIWGIDIVESKTNIKTE